MSVTVEVINNKALNLLSDMEHLDLIGVKIPPQTASGPNPYTHLAGALKLSDTQYAYYQKTLQEGRNEKSAICIGSQPADFFLL